MEKLTTINILNVPVHPLTMEEAVKYLVHAIGEKRTINVVTANAEIIMLGQDNKEYLNLLQKAELVLPDGAGAVWAGRTLGYDVPERVAGFDLFVNLVKEAARQGFKLYFFGASPGIAEKAKAKCEKIAPGVQIVGCRNGYFTHADEKEIIEDINKSGADILFTALGAPKQEFWLEQFSNELNPYIRMGLGGSFDVLAGKMERAPKWMQDCSLEWLFRLYKQPSRIGRMVALPKFVIKVLKAKYL